jgi:gliding motility-associated-like protein
MNKFFFKKSYYIFIIGIYTLITQMSYSQGFYNTVNWKFSNPTQTGITYLDVDYFDNNNVLAVGGNGGIAKSVDGGRNWKYGPFTYVSSPATGSLLTMSTLNDVHYATANVAYTVGDRGCMAKTTDGGQNWSFVTTPLFANSKNIYACWFLNKDTGYIGGDVNNNIDSLPRLYVTKNGGATWDSILPPAVNGVSRVGYINNPNISSTLWPVDAKLKSIYRIEFINDSIGYVTGSNSYGVTLFPNVCLRATSATVCTPLTSFLTSGSMAAGMLWKFKSGVLTDYSFSKERLGYTGINTNIINCSTTFGAISPISQTYRAMNILNDSTVVLMSFNNNCAVRVSTGKNDSTANVNNVGSFEKGKYTVLNFPFPPTLGPNAGPPIPATQVLLASNPYKIKRASNGKLYAGGNFGKVWTSIDNGDNWKEERSYPPGQNYSANAAWALDIAPDGRFLFMGTNGAVADSIPGGSLFSNYNLVAPGGGYSKFDFVNCNTGIGAGGAAITRTLDGGKTWLDNNRPDFTSSFYSITGLSYPTLTKAYFSVNNGTIYRSDNANASQAAFVIDPIYSDVNFQMNDIAAIGNDTVYALGYSSFSVPTANRKSSIFRSYNNGVSWQAIDIVATTTTPAFTAPTLSQLAFPSRNIGYAAGSRNGIYKTIDGGSTWTSINPFPVVNQFPTGFPNTAIIYTEIMAVDNNTVFAVGNMFTSTGIKRVYKTIDGGSNWIDITSNIPALFPVGNITGVLFHDANNGYVMIGNTIFKTSDGGTSWIMDISPTGIIGQTMAFAPRTVPAAISMVNRKMFFAGFSGPGGSSNNIMEYGNPADITVNSTETITNANCTNLTSGAITINTTGGIVPYTYSINGGAFQSSNSFNGLTQGPKTITIKDAFCGTLIKTINVGFNDNLVLTTSNDTSVCAGAPVPMLASTNVTGATYTWTPTTGLSAANVANPTAIINNATVYNVTASLNGCIKNKNINVGIRPNPSVNAGPDFTIVSGDDVTLLGSGALNVTNINWTPVTNIISGSTTFSPIVKPPTTTTFTLTVKDANSCNSTDNAIVTVIPYCVGIKDAFTPNGDGVNDRWLVTNGATCTNQIIAEVYNRYGGLIYRSDNYNNNWDGTYNGKPVADGTYYFKVSFRLINGKTIFQTGNVTILR